MMEGVKAYRYFGLFIAVAALALALHSPGEISVDSGRQLHEAAIGSSLTWNPPFMSAWLRTLGSGLVASSLFIFVNSLVTYSAFAWIIGILERRSAVSKWRVVASILLALNPIFFYYVGIVWKDVLMATALVAISALVVTAVGQQRPVRVVLILISTLLTALLPLIRQQGIIVAPIFIAIECFLLVRAVPGGIATRASLTCMLVLFAFGAYKGASHWSNEVIAGADGRDVSSGIQLVMFYDIAGVASNILNGKDAALVAVPEDVVSHMRQSYAPDRVDKLMADPIARRYLSSLKSFSDIKRDWLRSIELYPAAYLHHKLDAFAWLLGFHDINKCRPMLVGKYTLQEDAKFAGGQVSFDDRAHLLGRWSVDLSGSPVFRNWFYLMLLASASVGVFFISRGELRVVTAAILGAGWLYLFTFIPTSIACDVRYLYPVAVISTIGCMICLLSSRLRGDAGSSEL